MDTNGEEIARVRAIIEEHPDGLSINEAARMAGIHRNTAAKYLEILHSQGTVDIKRIGVSKLYYPGTRIPVSSVLRIFSDPVILTGRDMMIAGGNRAASDLLGEEVFTGGNTSIEHIAGLIGRITISQLPDIFGGSWKTWEIEPRDNHSISLIRGIPVIFDNGRTGAALVLSNLAGYEAMQNRLERYNAVWKTVQEIEPVYTLRMREDGVCLFANNAYARLFSRFPYEIEGTVHFPRMPKEDQKIFSGILADLKKNGNASGDFRILHPEGDIRFHRWSFRRIEVDPIEFLGFGLDITGLKSREEQFTRFYEGTENLFSERTKELRELNRQLYREINERERIEETVRIFELSARNVADIILWFTPDGKIRYANTAARQILNLPGELNETDISRVIRNPPVETWEVFWETIRRDGNVFRETMLTADDSSIPTEMLYTYIISDSVEYCCCTGRDIQQRMQAMNELIENEDRFRQLAEAITDLFYLRDLNTREFLYINPASSLIYGRTPSEFYRDPDLMEICIHPKDREHLIPPGHGGSGRTTDQEYRIIRPDGKVRWVQARSFIITDAHGTPYREGGLVMDITERRSIEDELVLSSELFRTTLMAAPVAVFSQDTDLRYVWIENAGFSLTKEQVLGKVDQDIFPGPVATLLTGLKRSVIDTGEECVHDVAIPHGGYIRKIRLFLRPSHDTSGAIRGVIGAAIDFTDVMEVEDQLRHNEELCEHLFEGIAEGIIFLQKKPADEPDFQIVDINPQACRITGKEKEDIVGTLLSRYGPGLITRWMQDIPRVLRQPYPSRYEGYSDFAGKYLSMQVIPITSDEIALAIHDISDLIRVYEQLDSLYICIGAAVRMAGPDDIIPHIVTGVLHGSGIDAISILGRLKEDQHLSILYSEGFRPDKIPSRPVRITRKLHEAYMAGDPVYYSRYQPLPAPLRSLYANDRLVSMAVFPITGGDILTGLLIVGSHTEEEIPLPERRYLEILSSVLAGVFGRERNAPVFGDQEIGGGYQVIDSTDHVIEGSAPVNADGTAIEGVRNMIHSRKEDLITGKEVSSLVEWPDRSGGLWTVRVRFIPWDASVGYLAIWSRI